MDVKRHLKGEREYEIAYQACVEWWKEWKFPAPTQDFLPQVMLVVYNESIPIAAGFIYQTDSKICWLEWIVASQKAEKAIRAQALDHLIAGAKLLSQVLGYGLMFVSSRNQSLNHRLGQVMQLTDSGMSHFIWRG